MLLYSRIMMGSRTAWRKTRVRKPVRLELTALEERTLLSNLVWVNRGQDSDRFAEVFQNNAEVARRVVDAAVGVWATALDRLNFPNRADPNRYELTISMEAANAGFTSTGGGGYGGDGFPTAGQVTLGRGNDVDGDGKGDGAGWFLDPTPADHVEFTDVINAFAARAKEGSPAFGLTDLYSFVNAELYHALGFISFAPGGAIQSKLQNPLNGRVVETSEADRDPDRGTSKYFVFDGPSITALLTAFDSGEGDTRAPAHSAGPTRPATNEAIPFNSQFRNQVLLTGGVDAGNAVSIGPSRVLVPDNLVLILKDAYGFDIKLPSTLPNGTFLAQQNVVTRQLMVQGGQGTSQDMVSLRRDGNDLLVTVNNQMDGPVPAGLDDNADGDAPAFVTRFLFGDIQSIVFDMGDGDDDVFLDFSAGDVIPVGGVQDNAGDGFDELILTGNGVFTVNGNLVTIPGFGSITLNGSEEIDLVGGPGADTFNVSNFLGTINLDGQGGNDTYNLNLRGSGDATINIFDAAGMDTVNVRGTARDDFFTADGSSLRLGDATETVTYSDSEIETLSISTGLGNDVVVVAGFRATTILRLDGSAGNDSFDASAFLGTAFIDGGAGDDILIGGAGNDVLMGSFGHDILQGNGGDDLLDGGFGNDVLHGNEGNDTALGGAGNDELAGGAGIDLLSGGHGDDVIDALDGEIDIIHGGSGWDVCDQDRGDRVTKCETKNPRAPRPRRKGK